MYAWRLMCRKKNTNLVFQLSNHLSRPSVHGYVNYRYRYSTSTTTRGKCFATYFGLRNNFSRLFSIQLDKHTRLGKQDQNNWFANEKLAIENRRDGSPIFKNEFKRRIIPWEKLIVSWTTFPYYICNRSKEVLVECVVSHLKNNKFATSYGAKFSFSSRRILLQSVSGTYLYKERLVKALAHDLKVPLLVLDSNVLAPYDFGGEELSENDDDNEEESNSESDTEDEYSSESDTEDENDQTDKISCWKPSKSKPVEFESKRSLKKCMSPHHIIDRIKYIIDPSSVDTEKRDFDRDDATKTKTSLHWLDDKEIEHNEESQAEDVIEALNEVLSSVQPLIVYFPDPSVWLSRAVAKTRREEFLNKLQEMLDNLSGPVVLICGQNKVETDSSSDKKTHLKQLTEELKSTKMLEGYEILQLFSNVINIHPPKEKDVLRTFNEQLVKDMQIVLTRSNITQLQKVIEEHNLTCMDLLDIHDNGHVILNKLKTEKVVGWAINLHLSSCIEPSVKGERLNLPLKCIETALARLTRSHECLPMNLAQSLKNCSNIEKHFVSSVVRRGEIGIKFDDIGALEEVKQALDELVILPMRRPELFYHGNLLQPCKGILLFGPPGTGKTLIAKSLATEADANFINVTASTISLKWTIDVEKVIKALFSFASKLAPVIIFIDEIDSLLGKCDTSSLKNMKSEFISAWEGLRSEENKRIVIIGATNKPFDLDDAMIRRLPRRIYVDLPNVDNRVKILKVLLAKENKEPEFPFEKLATATDKYSGRDLKNLCTAAAYRPVHELIEEEKKGLRSDSVLRPLNLDDFIQSKDKVVPSVIREEFNMTELKKWTEKFGQGKRMKKMPQKSQDLIQDKYERNFVSSLVHPGEIGIKFDDVGALEEVKQALDELVILPMRRPELFSHGNLLKPCNGILLFGPPGTGKTLIAKALATEAGTNFINITASTITSMWHGESEKYAKALFSYANKLAPVIIFVDEIDSLLGARRSYEHESSRKVKNEFMAAWDGLGSKENQRILIIGATNRPFDLDDAVVRRLPRRIYIDLPDAANRVKILKTLLVKENIEPGFQFEKLARATNGYSGSDLKNLCVATAYRPVQEVIDEEKNKGLRSNSVSVVEMRPLNLADFIQSMAKVAPSVAYEASNMNELRKWNEKYGQGGSRKTSCFGFANECG